MNRKLIDQTKQLIAIQSTAANPAALKEAVDFVATIVAAHPGITIERFARNGRHSFLAYRGTTRPEKFDVLLNAHVDIVPGEPEQFKPYEKDGKLYGRGALDMKGTALVLTDVFCEVVNSVPYALGLEIVSDEEVGGYDGARMHIADGLRADFVVMGEYANERNAIYNAARGLCWAEIAFTGKAAHGAHLWHGNNAVLKASAFADAILKRYPTPDTETLTTTANVSSITTANETFNKVPDSAVLKIDFRFTQEDPVFHTRESLEAFFQTIDPDATIVNLATFEPAVHVEELNPYVQGLSSALKQVTGQKPRFLGRPGASDGRHFSQVQNDVVEFGLYGHDPHSDNECVELDSFDEYRSVMAAFLKKPLPARLKQTVGNAEGLHMQLLRKLVDMPTVTGHAAANKQALSYVSHFLATRGLHVKHFEHNGFHSLVATTKPDSTTPTVMLSAHIDVVPGKKEQFSLSEKGGKLYGRGVMDMKFAIASYLALVDSIKDTISDYDFGIMITSDEEVGGVNGTGWLINEFGYHPKVAIVPDGGENWELETFAKGVQWIKLSAAGKPSHASRPWEGESAIHRLLGALDEIRKLVPEEPVRTGSYLSVGTIEGGSTANQLAADASAMLDIRTGSLNEHNELTERITAISKTHGVIADVMVNDPPCVNDAENPYITAFVGLVAAVTGEEHNTSYSFGATDARLFNQAGVPCVIMEPPAGDRHQETEWLSRQGFDQFCAILAQYIERIAHNSAGEITKEDNIRHLANVLNPVLK
ncbi:MAG TPA: M20/M25/M40 family metallo-hydrolase [Candidatus Saccharimonadales bacterium]|nr:M20/M25/M40 family metallo-hydrolase [Candidatus Saccharimonadales bacterium]